MRATGIFRIMSSRGAFTNAGPRGVAMAMRQPRWNVSASVSVVRTVADHLVTGSSSRSGPPISESSWSHCAPGSGPSTSP